MFVPLKFEEFQLVSLVVPYSLSLIKHTECILVVLSCGKFGQFRENRIGERRHASAPHPAAETMRAAEAMTEAAANFILVPSEVQMSDPPHGGGGAKWQSPKVNKHEPQLIPRGSFDSRFMNSAIQIFFPFPQGLSIKKNDFSLNLI